MVGSCWVVGSDVANGRPAKFSQACRSPSPTVALMKPSNCFSGGIGGGTVRPFWTAGRARTRSSQRFRLAFASSGRSAVTTAEHHQLAEHRTERRHLVDDHLDGLDAALRVFRQQLAGLLGHVKEDGA